MDELNNRNGRGWDDQTRRGCERNAKNYNANEGQREATSGKWKESLALSFVWRHMRLLITRSITSDAKYSSYLASSARTGVRD